MTPIPQQQTVPGSSAAMTPQPDYGEATYTGSGRLSAKTAVVTGADSGIGRAVALAYAREGADVVISYLSEHEDAQETARLVEAAGQRSLLVASDLSMAGACRDLIDAAVGEFGSIDILVHNAAFQMTRESLEEIPDDEWEYTIATNLGAYFHLAKAAVSHMKEGSCIIATTSIQADSPSPALLPYAATKAAIANMTGSMAQLLGPKGIRVNAVAPGPIWTPLIPATMPPEVVASFGEDTPLGRAGQPAELAGIYVLLASAEGSYMSGAIVPVTGGKPIL
jgi:NAD(P)-dependent dehydrogenase (short-subunit alcohol dehydrogenase family)